MCIYIYVYIYTDIYAKFLQLCLTLCDPRTVANQAPWDFPGKSNPHLLCLLHWRVYIYIYTHIHKIFYYMYWNIAQP